MPGVGGIGTGGERVSQQGSVRERENNSPAGERAARGLRTAGLKKEIRGRGLGRKGALTAGCTERGDRPAVTFPGTTSGPGLSGPGVLQGRPGHTVLLGLGAEARGDISRSF